MLYIALLHYPVYNKDGKVVTTSVVNMDIHDIARVSRTYGVRNFFVVNPIDAQLELAGEIISHWSQGYGAVFNPLRREAFSLVRLKTNLEEVKTEIAKQTGKVPQVVVTSANFQDGILTCLGLRKMMSNDGLPYLLIFGTGWGITEEIVNGADYLLEPIKGVAGYNHLPVRSAVAIVLDRIFGNQINYNASLAGGNIK
jgi:hypothetical protein